MPCKGNGKLVPKYNLYELAPAAAVQFRVTDVLLMVTPFAGEVLLVQLVSWHTVLKVVAEDSQPDNVQLKEAGATYHV